MDSLCVLCQVKNSLSAVRMFGKLLLRRLPGNDKMNRELAKDILIQSDRLVDLLLPIDSMTRQPSLGPGANLFVWASLCMLVRVCACVHVCMCARQPSLGLGVF